MSTGVGNSILRKLKGNSCDPLDVDTDAKDVATCVERFWGDMSVQVLEKAVEVAKERAKR